jgi:hypothetical protein
MPAVDPNYELNEPYHRISGNISTITAIIVVIRCEVAAIHGLWFTEAIRDQQYLRYILPLFIALPALFLLIFRRASKRWVARDEMTSGLEARIINGLGSIFTTTYICILLLAELAFTVR